MTVNDLIAALVTLPADLEVKVWLPGSTISLSRVWHHEAWNMVLIEGNVDPGSALIQD